METEVKYSTTSSGESHQVGVFTLMTTANLSLQSFLPELDVKLGNLKDPVKIEEKIAKAKEGQIEDMSTFPLWGRCASFGMATLNSDYTINGKIEHFQLAEDTDEAERELLTHFFTKYSTMCGKLGYSWTGAEFVKPFIWQRASILGLSSLLISSENMLYAVRDASYPETTMASLFSVNHKREDVRVYGERVLGIATPELSIPVDECIKQGLSEELRGRNEAVVKILSGLLVKSAGFLVPESIV